MRIEKDFSLLAYNTFGIDVKCQTFIEYDSPKELRQIVGELSSLRHTRFLHIGGGSNLLFTKNYDGYIIHSGIHGIETIRENEEEIVLRVGAAENWDDFVAYCVVNGYHGAENLSLIPGEVGASAVQNIGAYGVEVEQLIEKVEAIEIATGQLRIFQHIECKYDYRYSIFKGELQGKYIIVAVHYRLSKRFSPQLAYGALVKELAQHEVTHLTPEKLRAQIIAVRQSKLPDPKKVGNAGSFFMNPVVSEEIFQMLQSRYPEMPHYKMSNGIKIPAGWMIEMCGWKGKALGQAAVHDRQALVLVNCGGATGSEVVALSDAVRRDVKKTFGIDIYPEVMII